MSAKLYALPTGARNVALVMAQRRATLALPETAARFEALRLALLEFHTKAKEANDNS